MRCCTPDWTVAKEARCAVLRDDGTTALVTAVGPMPVRCARSSAVAAKAALRAT